MSLLDRLHQTAADARPGPDDGPVRPLLALLTGIWTAALSWLVVVLPALLAWATSAQSTAPWGQAVRVSSDVWLAVHRVGIEVPGGVVALAPIGGLALPVALCWLGGRRIGASLGAQPAVSVRAVAPAVGSLAVGYAAVTTLVALVARGDGVRPVVWQAVVLGLVLPAVSALVAALRAGGSPVAAALGAALRLPDRGRRTLRPAVMTVGVLLAVAALLVAVALVVRFGRVVTLHQALGPGAVGGGVLTLVEATFVPNLVVWGVAFLAGPGFALGVGTSVTPAGSDLGLLPLVPVLGAVPAPGPLPAAFTVLLLVPVVVGALVGWWVTARGPRAAAMADGSAGVLDAVAEALTAVAWSGLLLTVLLAASGGAAGPGALSAVGPSPWRAGLVLTAELAMGAAAAAWATHRRRRP